MRANAQMRKLQKAQILKKKCVNDNDKHDVLEYPAGDDKFTYPRLVAGDVSKTTTHVELHATLSASCRML